MMQNLTKKIAFYVNLFRDKSDQSLTKRLFGGISWTLIGNVSGKFLQLLAFIVVARIVGKEEYGQIGMVRSTINMFLVFSSAGMGVTATRYIAMYRTSNPRRAYRVFSFSLKVVLCIGVLIAAIVFFGSNYIAQSQLDNIQLNVALKIGALVLFFLTVSSVQIGAINGFEKFKSGGIITIVNGLILLISVVIGAYAWGIDGVVVGLGVSAAAMVLMLHLSLKRNIRAIKNTQELTEKRGLNLSSIFFKFSLPAVLQGLMVVPVVWWAKTMLIQESGYGEMALFDVAEQWYYLALFVPNSLSAIILPLLTDANYNGSKEQYWKLLRVNLLINIGVTFLIAAVIAIFSPFIYKFYGSGFANYSSLLILLVAVVICAANNVLGQVIVSKGKMWIGFGANAIWAIWLIIFTFAFVYKYQLGALGLAYALLASYTLHSVVQGLIAIKMKYENFE